MANARKSLRKAIWPSGKDPNPRDIGEALRDVDQSFKSLTAFDIRVATSITSGTPFVVAFDHSPAAVIIGRVLVTGSTKVGGSQSRADFTWDGTQLNIPGIVLTGGDRYDVTLLIFG